MENQSFRTRWYCTWRTLIPQFSPPFEKKNRLRVTRLNANTVQVFKILFNFFFFSKSQIEIAIIFSNRFRPIAVPKSIRSDTRVYRRAGLHTDESLASGREFTGICFTSKPVNGLISCPESLRSIRVHVPHQHQSRSCPTFSISDRRHSYGHNSIRTFRERDEIKKKCRRILTTKTLYSTL